MWDIQIFNFYKSVKSMQIDAMIWLHVLSSYTFCFNDGFFHF